jgi:hypothetical protein
MPTSPSPSQLIDRHIAGFSDWRGETLAQLRAMIRSALPAVTEEWKWGGPVWSSAGIVCTGEIYKSTVKLTFAQGASLDDPSKLFNSSLSGNLRRAIDVREGERLNARAFKALVKSAARFNSERSASSERRAAKTAQPNQATKPTKPVRLLSGDNPQIAKAYGDAPVQAYIAAIPDWRGKAAVTLDALITRTVPSVKKAVKWNSAFYGAEDGRWFLCFRPSPARRPRRATRISSTKSLMKRASGSGLSKRPRCLAKSSSAGGSVCRYGRRRRDSATISGGTLARCASSTQS